MRRTRKQREAVHRTEGGIALILPPAEHPAIDRQRGEEALRLLVESGEPDPASEDEGANENEGDRAFAHWEPKCQRLPCNSSARVYGSLPVGARTGEARRSAVT